MGDDGFILGDGGWWWIILGCGEWWWEYWVMVGGGGIFWVVVGGGGWWCEVAQFIIASLMPLL